MTTPVHTNGLTPQVWTEAPASATFRVTTPGGYEVLLTTRASKMADLIAQLATLETWLIDRDWKPAGQRPQAPGNGQSEDEAAQAPLCGFHGNPMQKRQGRNGAFWSCSQKLPNGEFCSYRPPKGGAS